MVGPVRPSRFHRAVTFYGGPFEVTYSRRGPTDHGPKTTIQRPRKGPPDFKFELRPLHSPLLRASRLVSFPPLINMLKFGGWSRSIRGRGIGAVRTAARTGRARVVATASDGGPQLRRRRAAPRGASVRPGSRTARPRSGFAGSAVARAGRRVRVFDARTNAPRPRDRGTICVQSFKDSRQLQFTRVIALRCVLPRTTSRGIRR